MSYQQWKFTREFKIAALRRLDASASRAEVAQACEINRACCTLVFRLQRRRISLEPRRNRGPLPLRGYYVETNVRYGPQWVENLEQLIDRTPQGRERAADMRERAKAIVAEMAALGS